MKYIYRIKGVVRTILVLLFISILVFGCATIKRSSLEPQSVGSSRNLLELKFQKSGYTSYKINFVPHKDQVIITSVDDVAIYNLITGDNINNLKIPELSTISSTYVSKQGDNYYLFASDTVQVWKTSDWKLLKKLKAERILNSLGGVSENESFLYFAAALWSESGSEKIFEFNDIPIATSYDFSPGNKYFIVSSHLGGMPIVDINNRKFHKISHFKKGASQVSFHDNTSFYASYGAKLDVTKGGYLPEKLGYFNINDSDPVDVFSQNSKISCWVDDADQGLLVSLYNGDIYLLNHQLVVQFKWYMSDYIRACSMGNNSDVWLGGNGSGIYNVNLEQREITKEYSTNNPISSLVISSDNRYLGITELLPGETEVKIFQLH